MTHQLRAAYLPVACAIWALIAGIARADESLYDRVGAEKMAAIVGDYVDALSSDPRTQRSFYRSDLKRVKKMLNEHLCNLTSGPCEYSGDSMRDIHAGQGITHSEFLSGVELLREVLANHRVPLRERNELLALLAPMKGDVVDP